MRGIASITDLEEEEAEVAVTNSDDEKSISSGCNTFEWDDKETNDLWKAWKSNEASCKILQSTKLHGCYASASTGSQESRMLVRTCKKNPCNSNIASFSGDPAETGKANE